MISHLITFPPHTPFSASIHIIQCEIGSPIHGFFSSLFSEFLKLFDPRFTPASPLRDIMNPIGYLANDPDEDLLHEAITCHGLLLTDDLLKMNFYGSVSSIVRFLL